MDANNNDNYVLVLEDRTEVKNEAEVGKLSVVSNIDEKGKLKTAPAEEAALCPMICAHFVAAFAPNVQEDGFSLSSKDRRSLRRWGLPTLSLMNTRRGMNIRYFHTSYLSI